MTSAAAPPGEIEHNLITRAQQGDREALGELVRCHREGVINVVYRMCGDAALAEDAAQEAFIRAWQHLAGYQPRSPFRNWVYRIAANVALDVLRREKETADIDAVQVAALGPGPEAALIEHERAERVRQAVLALPPASRAVLVLREYEGLSYQEIAYTLDIPLGTVMSRLNYARNRMREALAAYLEGAMNEHISAWLDAYHDGELDGRRLRQVETHLADCAACRAELDRLQALSALLQASPAAGRLTSPERFVAQVGLRLPRHPAQPLSDRAASLGWRLAPVGLLGAYAIVQAVFIVAGIVAWALRLGGEPARQGAAWLNRLGTGFYDLSPIGLPILDRLPSISWGLVLYLGLMAMIGLLYWSWLATWWVRQHHRSQSD